jgi:hypothetical protein
MAKPPETPDINVRTIRTAKTLIERHGDGALGFAETQAERLAKDGSKASAAEWKAVAAAIRQLTGAAGKR